MSYAYKFVTHDVPPKPDSERTRLLEKAQDKRPLTRAEKDEIADILWGTFGCQRSAYREGGWAWPMHACLRRILVAFTWERGRFQTYYAPDKSALRKCLDHVAEMVYA